MNLRRTPLVTVWVLFLASEVLLFLSGSSGTTFVAHAAVASLATLAIAALVLSMVGVRPVGGRSRTRWSVVGALWGMILGALPFCFLILLGPATAIDVAMLPGKNLLRLIGRESYFSSSHLEESERFQVFNEVLLANSLAMALMLAFVGAAIGSWRTFSSAPIGSGRGEPG